MNETPGEYITRVMAQKGFAPLNVYSASHLEFAKSYADPLGRIARAVVQFERPGVLGGDVRLSGFNVLVQAHVTASVEAVAERAPPVMQDDLVDIVRAFEEERRPPVVAFERCSSCQEAVAEFFVVEGAVLCRDCRR